MTLLKRLRGIQNRVVAIDKYAIWSSLPDNPAPDLDNKQTPRGVVTETPRFGADETSRLHSPGKPVAMTYSYLIDGKAVCHSTVRFAESYRRATLRLKSDEVKLIDIITEPAYRGLGVAPQLIRHITRKLVENGYVKLYARVWHSNFSSHRAFRRAGWHRAGTVYFIHARKIGLSPGEQRMVRVSIMSRASVNLLARVFPRMEITRHFLSEKY